MVTCEPCSAPLQRAGANVVWAPIAHAHRSEKKRLMWHTSARIQWLRAYRCVGIDKPVAQIFGQVLDQVCRYAAPGNAKAFGFLAHVLAGAMWQAAHRSSGAAVCWRCTHLSIDSEATGGSPVVGKSLTQLIACMASSHMGEMDLEQLKPFRT